MVQAAAKTASVPLEVLLVGEHEEDFFLIREVLERHRATLAAELEHAHSLDEAKLMLEKKPYGLVLFEHQTGSAEAVGLLSEFHHAGISVPFILLTEGADVETIAKLIGAGTWNCLAKSQLDGATLLRTIRSTLALHSIQKEQQSAEESLCKLSRAVEQSADTVVITDRQGVIEYVNPAFEAVTGYRRHEACGKTPRILKSGGQGPEVYRNCGRPSLRAKCFAEFW